MQAFRVAMLLASATSTVALLVACGTDDAVDDAHETRPPIVAPVPDADPPITTTPPKGMTAPDAAPDGEGSRAAPGVLDPRFGQAGKVSIDFGGYDDEAHAVALGAGGRIVVAGSGGGAPTSFAVACLLPDGSLDTSFGVGGRTTTAFHRPDGSAGQSSADAVAVYPDGRILAAGRAHVNPSGSLYLATPDGGYANDDFVFVRYMPDGTLDPTFGTGGIAQIAVSTLQERVRGVVLGPGDTILASGVESFIPEINKLVVLRLLGDGHLDPTFATGGAFVYTHPSPPGQNTDQLGYAIALSGAAASPSIVVGGSLRPAASNHRLLASRLDATGSLDLAFGAGGIALAGDPPSDEAYAFATQVAADGSIYLGGVSGKSPAVVRLSPNGGVDTTFGTNGVARVPVADRGIGYALVLAGGLPVLGGVEVTGAKVTPVLHRFLANGSSDPAFANGGSLVSVSGVAGITALANDGDHSLVAVGAETTIPSSTKSDMFVLRVGN